MTDALEKLKTQSEMLTNHERAELAQFLIRLLDQTQDEDAEEAWEAELSRRVTEIKGGKAVGKLLNRCLPRSDRSDRSRTDSGLAVIFTGPKLGVQCLSRPPGGPRSS